MEENCVSGFFNVYARILGCKQNPEVSVEEREPHEGETNDVWRVPLLQAVAASEHVISGTEQVRVEEVLRLGGQQDEEIRQDGARARRPDQTNQDVGFLDGADLSVAEGHADGDVALDCHAGQIEGGVEGGEDGDDEQEEAEGYVDGVKGVADDVEKRWQNQLHHVIDHQVDEQDVTRVGVKDLEDKISLSTVSFIFRLLLLFQKRKHCTYLN